MSINILQLKKILILRFSSIGDIVLTTPIIRCAKIQLNGTQIHFVTKDQFKNVIINNPYIDKLFTFKHDVLELFEELKSENYDLIIDLHKNIRSYKLKFHLKSKSYSFNKLNFKKFLAVIFNNKNQLPKEHIVDRYFKTIANIGVFSDQKGLDYFIDKASEVNCTNLFFNNIITKFLVIVIGGSYFTKKIPLNKLIQICSLSKYPIILLGGPHDVDVSNKLIKIMPNVIDGCGKFSFNQSASVIQQAEWVITSDTGLMHVASAFNKKIISVWGNTIPQFGMDPYLPNNQNIILENNNLNCRPCSKLGYNKCPKGHFKCMEEIDFSFVSELK